jgi:hypothetical protein
VLFPIAGIVFKVSRRKWDGNFFKFSPMAKFGALWTPAFGDSLLFLCTSRQADNRRMASGPIWLQSAPRKLS